MLCALLAPASSFSVLAEDSDNSLLTINTLYPKDVLDYQNLDNITNTAISSDYIAYSIDANSIHIINRTSKYHITSSQFSNILDFKFIANNILLLINFDDSSKNGNVYVVEIIDNNISVSTISTINITNLVVADIYNHGNSIYLGVIKSQTSDNNIFELHELSINNNVITAQRIDTFPNALLNSATHLILSEDKHYVIFENDNDDPRILTRDYGDDSTSPQTTSFADNVSIAKLYIYDNKEYIVAFTKENLYLIDTIDTSTTITSLDKLDLIDIDVVDSSLIISNPEVPHDELLVADPKNKSISTIDIDNTSDQIALELGNVLISSAHSALGRFNNVSNIIVQGSRIILSDSNNDRIQIIDNKYDCQEIPVLPVDSNIHAVLLDSHQNIFFNLTRPGTNTSTIYKYNYNPDVNGYTETDTPAATYSTCQSADLGLVSDITITNKDELFVLDETNNQLLSLNNTGLQLAYTFNQDILSSAEIEYIRGLNMLAVLNDGNLLLLSIDNITKELNPLIDQWSDVNYNSITAGVIDILALADNNIVQISIENSELILTNNSITNNDFSHFSTITYDNNSGIMYAFNSNNQSINYFDCGLTYDALVFDKITAESLNSANHQPLAIEIINDGIIYEQPYNIGNKFVGITQCIAIEISSNQYEYDNYYRVLFNYNGELASGFLSSTNARIISHNTTQQIKVITTNLQVPVYKYPTLLKQNDNALINSYLDIETKIYISVNPFPVRIDGKYFYAYIKDGKVGYIFNADVVIDDSTHIVNLNTNNATISAIGLDKVDLYSEDMTEVITSINNGQGIYVENYDKNSDYTLVIYKDENLKTYKGYIKTDYIKMDKIDNTTMVLILIIVLSVLILVIITTTYFIIRRKKS